MRDEYEKEEYVSDEEIDPNVVLYQETMEIRSKTED